MKISDRWQESVTLLKHQCIRVLRQKVMDSQKNTESKKENMGRGSLTDSYLLVRKL